MRFKVIAEFIQSTDPDDFKLKGKKTPERIAMVILKDYINDSEILEESLKYAAEQETIKIVKVEYLDDEF